jgi:hypothetical protein
MDINIDVDAFGDGETVLLDQDAYDSNSERFNFQNFDQINIEGPYHVQLTQGNKYSVRVRASQREIDRMEVAQNGSELKINYKDKTINLFDDREPILIMITAPNINKIDLSGAIKANVGTISGDNLHVNLSGATKAAFNVRTKNLTVDIAGASASKFTGTTDQFNLDASGAVSVDADQLRARQVDIDASGMTAAQVYASAILRAEASGASQIKYKGNPANTNINADGASKVVRE